MIVYVYRIRSELAGKEYIGITTRDIRRRYSEHIMKYKKHMEGRYGYVTSFEILEYEDHYIEVIKRYSGITKDEARVLENQYIEAGGLNVVNRRKNITTRLCYRCDCGGEYNGGTYRSHLLSAIHKRHVEESKQKET